MKVEHITEKNISDLVKFLRENNKLIPDKAVRPVYTLRYHTELNPFEHSHLLAALESQSLLDKEKSVNGSGSFYTEMHKKFKKDLSNV